MAKELERRRTRGDGAFALTRLSWTSSFLRARGLLRSAALRVRNQFVLLPALACGMVLGALSLPVLAAAIATTGMGLYGGMIARDLVCGSVRSEKWLHYPLELENQFRMEEAESSLLERIVACHESIRAEVRAANPMLRGSLIDIYVRCTEMAFEAAALAEQSVALGRYLSRASKTDLEDEYVELVASVDSNADDESSTMTAAAADRKLAQVMRHGDIESIHDRLRARMSLVKVTLELVEATLVKLRACDHEATSRARYGVEEHAEALSATVTVLESCLVEALQE